MPYFDTSLDDSSEGLQGAALRTAQLADAMQNARLPGPPVAVNPPPAYSPAPGTGVMYATNGPAANFSTALTGPGGAPLPANAQNVRFVQGPPPEDPETQMMRKFLSAIPVDQAEKAIQVAQQFQAKRAYQKRASQNVDPAQNLMQYFVESGATGGGMKSSDLSNLARAQEAFTRAKVAQNPTMNPFQQAQVQRWNMDRALKEKENAAKAAEANRMATAGPVQAQPVMDPITKQPIPGLAAVPSASGKGWDYKLTKPEAQMTAAQAATILAKLPAIDAAMNVDTKDTNSLTAQLAPQLSDAIKKSVKPASAKATETATTPMPFKEGQTIRNKKTGKLYRIVKGNPVEITQ